MKIKRKLALLLASAMLFCLTGCNSSKNDQSGSSGDSQATPQESISETPVPNDPASSSENKKRRLRAWPKRKT